MLMLTPWHMALLLAFSVALCARAQASGPGREPGPASPRKAVTLNREWTFNYFPDGGSPAGPAPEAPDFDDRRWPAVAVPHTWQTYETTREVHPYIRAANEREDPYWWTGWGWYRKHLQLDAALAGRNIFLEFDGVQKHCRIFVNGKKVGEHKGGYASFSVEVTEAVNLGQDNVVAVAVNNTRNDPDHIPPMAAGNFNVYGGIYRDVRVVITDKLHVPFQGSAEHEGGTFVTTPKVSAAEAVARVRTWVRNDHPDARTGRLITTIVDAAGQTVATMSTEAQVPPGQVHTFDQTSEPIRAPRLWSPETPYVYRVSTQVFDGPRLADIYESPLGFRSFRWDAKENRLYLNDKPVAIHGTNRHQEYPWLGDAIPQWITLMDMDDIRHRLNHNFMRTAHYTHDRLVYDYADAQGLLMCQEVPNIKNQAFSKEVQEQQVREMVRRDRNHPSIIMWSVGNETNNAADSQWVHQEDDTRIIHARHVAGPSAGQFVTSTHANLEMEQLLKCTIRGWTHDEIKKYPGGAQTTGNEELQHAMALGSGRLGSPTLNVWLYEDHGADRVYANCPLKYVNPKGWVDSYRQPKYMYYLWQANFAEKPMVFVHPHFWTREHLGQKHDLIVNANGQAVELKVGDRSLGTLQPSAANAHTVVFKDVTVEDATLTAIATRGEQTVTATVPMAGPAKSLVLKTSHATFEAGLDSLAILTADVVDAKGNPVQGAHPALSWKVEGPGTLVAPAEYQSDLDKNGKLDGTMYITTPVATLVRSAGKPGTIRVSISAEGLAPASVQVEATPAAVSSEKAIIQPPLAMDGREPVRRTAAAAAVQVAQEIAPVGEDLTLAKSADAKEIAAFIKAKNPKVDGASPAFATLVDVLARHLQAKGQIVRDDYNFLAGKYNECREVSRALDATKLPEPFRVVLRSHYAVQAIDKGAALDIAKEKRRYVGVGADAKVAAVGKAPAGTGKEVLLVSETERPAIVAKLDPGFWGLDEAIRTRALEQLQELNPHLPAKDPLPEGTVLLVPPLRQLAYPGMP